jgi:NAD(P)-dependent dehydrogenase (short-subunit alcohol dehydrogenase family)
MESHLVIGAGGHIGTELTQRLSSKPDSKVIAVDVKKFSIFEQAGIEVLVRPFQSQVDFDALKDCLEALRVRGGKLRSVTFLQTSPEPSLRETSNFIKVNEGPHFARSQEIRRNLWLDYKPQDFMDQFEAHVAFTHQVLKNIYEHLMGSQECSIVFVGSVFASNPIDQRLLETSEQIIFKGPGYSAAKAALSNYMLSLTALFCDTGVRFNVISPGPVFSATRPQAIHDRLKAFALGERLITASEVAEVLEWIHSPNSRNVRGQVINVANGFGGF